MLRETSTGSGVVVPTQWRQVARAPPPSPSEHQDIMPKETRRLQARPHIQKPREAKPRSPVALDLHSRWMVQGGPRLPPTATPSGAHRSGQPREPSSARADEAGRGAAKGTRPQPPKVQEAGMDPPPKPPGTDPDLHLRESDTLRVANPHRALHHSQPGDGIAAVT